MTTETKTTRLYVTGNTYPVKEELRALGCRWDAGRRAWYTDSEEVAAKAREIVQPHPMYNSQIGRAHV